MGKGRFGKRPRARERQARQPDGCGGRACEKEAAKAEHRDDGRSHRRTDGPGERPACAKDADRAARGVGARIRESPPDERDRLGKDGRAERDRDDGDDEQRREIGRDGDQGVADAGSGKRDDQRREARPPVDPGPERGGEGDRAERSSGQDRAQREGAEACLANQKEHHVGTGERVGEAHEHVDDDKRDEERRAIGVRCQSDLVAAAERASKATGGKVAKGRIDRGARSRRIRRRHGQA